MTMPLHRDRIAAIEIRVHGTQDWDEVRSCTSVQFTMTPNNDTLELELLDIWDLPTIEEAGPFYELRLVYASGKDLGPFHFTSVERISATETDQLDRVRWSLIGPFWHRP